MTTLPSQTTTSISPPIEPSDRQFAMAVSAVLNSLRRPEGPFTAGADRRPIATTLPSAELRQAIKARAESIRRALLPLERSMAEKERAGRAVAAMLSGWVNARVADPAAKVAAYVATLGDLPCWVVERVCHDVARGHVEGLDPDFPPSAARLHQLGEEAISRLRKEAADLHAVATARLEVIASPDQRQRIHASAVAGAKRLAEGDDDEQKLRSEKRSRDNADALAREQARVREEYAALGRSPPSPLALSITARRELGIGVETTTEAAE